MKTTRVLLLFSILFALHCDAQKWLWAKEGANNLGTLCDPWAICTDTPGNVFIVGLDNGGVHFGSQFINTSGSPGGAFIVKYDSSGNVIWAKQGINAFTDYSWGNAVVADKSGCSYMFGTFANNVSFSTFTLTSGNNGATTFLVKYGPGGNVIWAKQSQNGSFPDYSKACAAAIDQKDNIYVTGYFAGTTTFGAYTLQSNQNSGGVFVVKYDSAGNVIWARKGTQSVSNYTFYNGSGATAIATDMNGNVYTTGPFVDSIYFAPYNLGNGG
ncbi:MAG TPA: hypothetical protein VNZ45_18230, partial [Bacteroidia bacterium]|nr:hypothetical protein [Bacteroidia bacterium]